MAAALGVNLGIVVHILAAAAGLSALLLAHPAAYDGIRLCGAAYLAWMAVQAWQQQHRGPPAQRPRCLAGGAAWVFHQCIESENRTFYLCLYSAIHRPRHWPIWVQILILGTIFLVNGALFTLCLGAGSGYFAAALGARAAF